MAAASPLISVPELAAALDRGEDPLLLDVRWTLSREPGAGPQLDAYRAGHLPGALFVDLERAATDAHAAGEGRHPLPQAEVFEAEMRALGVREDRAIVCYDGSHSMGAARLWWLLTDAGLDDVRVLDGGFAAWERAGLPVDQGEADAPDPSAWVARPGRRERARMDDVEQRRAAGAQLIDVRAAERFRGDSEPLDPVAGHIPGAVNVPIARVQRDDGTLRSPDEIQRAFHARPGDVFTCGSGITASLALLAYESAGGQGAMIYPGSWSQWSTAGRAVETGEPGRT